MMFSEIVFAHKYRGEANVCLNLCSDAAANQGQVFESFNVAKLWHVLLYVQVTVMV